MSLKPPTHAPTAHSSPLSEALLCSSPQSSRRPVSAALSSPAAAEGRDGSWCFFHTWSDFTLVEPRWGSFWLWLRLRLSWQVGGRAPQKHCKLAGWVQDHGQRHLHACKKVFCSLKRVYCLLLLMQRISRFQWVKKDREKTWYAFQITQHIMMKCVTELHVHLVDLICADNTVFGGSLVQSSLQTGLPAGSRMQRHSPNRFVSACLTVIFHAHSA